MRLKDEDKDKESSFKDKDTDKDLMSKDEDKDEDLKIFLEDPRGQGLSSRTTTLAAVRQYGEIDMNLNLTGVQWQISHPFVTKSLQDDGA